MLSPQALLKLITGRSLPAVSVDGPESERFARGGRYGEQYGITLIPDYYALADEGSYFVATNPTPSTGIAFGGAARTTFLDTDGGIALINNDNAASLSAKRIYLDYIKLILVTAAAGPITTPFIQMVIKTDNVQSRFAAGGSSITPANVNADSGVKSIATLNFGALTFNGSSPGARMVSRLGGFRGSVQIPGDVYVINFGAVEKSFSNGALAAATAEQQGVNAPPIVLGPNQVMTVHSWAPAQSAAAVYEFEIGWWER